MIRRVNNTIDQNYSLQLTTAPTRLNNLRTNADELNADKLKTVPIILKELSDIEDNDAVRKHVFNKLNWKIFGL